MKPVSPAPGRARLPLLLAALSTLGPFSIDTYLPAFPSLASQLRATPIEVQQSLTAYLVPFSLMTLWHGALSDAVGRRKVVVVGLALFALASVGCACSSSIGFFWLFRVLQGVVAGAGVIVGRAVVRDLYAGADAQRILARISLFFAAAPAVAPVIGGWLHEWFGWRSIFWFLCLLSSALAGWAALALPETLPPDRRHAVRPLPLVRAYGEALLHPVFLLSAASVAMGFSGLFLYIVSAPVFLMEHLGVSPTGFFWLFGPVTGGMMIGSILSGRLAGRLTRANTVGLGFGLMALAAMANVAIHIPLPAGLPWSVLPLCLYAAGMNIAAPVLMLIGLDQFPARRGLAASVQAFVFTVWNTLTAGLFAPTFNRSPLGLALASLVLLCGGIAAAVWMRLRQPVDDSNLPPEL